MMKLYVFLFICVISFFAGAETFQLVTLEYPPYEYTEDGKVKGIAVEVVKEAFKRMGHDVKITVLPWKRALMNVQEGSSDAIFTAYKTEEREKFLDYSKEVLMPQRTAFFVLADSGITFDGDLGKLKGKKIGTVIGVSYGEKFDTAIKSGQISTDSVKVGELNIKKLLAKRVQLIVSNEYGALFILSKLKAKKKVKMLQPVLQDIPSYIGFSKKRKLSKLRDLFDTTLQKMKADGSYDAILKKYK